MGQAAYKEHCLFLFLNLWPLMSMFGSCNLAPYFAFVTEILVCHFSLSFVLFFLFIRIFTQYLLWVLWHLRYSRKSLKVLGTVGEPINPEAWLWYYHVVGDEKCAIVDTYWQTETVSTCMLFKCISLSSNKFKWSPHLIYAKESLKSLTLNEIMEADSIWSTKSTWSKSPKR